LHLALIPPHILTRRARKYQHPRVGTRPAPTLFDEWFDETLVDQGLRERLIDLKVIVTACTTAAVSVAKPRVHDFPAMFVVFGELLFFFINTASS
jgi:hypothetical protein